MLTFFSPAVLDSPAFATLSRELGGGGGGGGGGPPYLSDGILNWPDGFTRHGGGSANMLTCSTL
jgi:hypothetical protein